MNYRHGCEILCSFLSANDFPLNRQEEGAPEPCWIKPYKAKMSTGHLCKLILGAEQQEN